jgi:hypothetical protein
MWAVCVKEFVGVRHNMNCWRVQRRGRLKVMKLGQKGREVREIIEKKRGEALNVE